MAGKKIREITIKESHGVFSFFGRNLGLKTTIQKESYDFSGVEALRHLLSKERARMLDVIKTQKPLSIYHLAKLLNRQFKSVFMDIRLLERFGLIELIGEKTKGRLRHKPILVTDELTIKLKI